MIWPQASHAVNIDGRIYLTILEQFIDTLAAASTPVSATTARHDEHILEVISLT